MSIVLNAQTDRPASYIQLENMVSSNLVRLVEDPDIPKKIRFDEISITNTSDPNTQIGGNKKLDEVGLVYPIIRINDIVLARQNIRSMTISMNGFMPVINLSLMFEDVSFLSKNMPKDGDLISLYIRTNTAALTYLRDDFVITKCYGSNGTRGELGSSVSLTGRLFIPTFDSKSQIASYIGTSKYVMREIAKAYGIGFAFNDFDDTNDFMNWIQCRESTPSFISNILKHAWKDRTSFFGAWIDLYYNLCFVNINKFILSTENQEEIDITFSSNVINMYKQLKGDSSVGEATMSLKVLSTTPEFAGSPFYINKWTPINKSTGISLSGGYSSSTFTYKHNQNVINDSDSDCFEQLTNIPAYDQNKTESYVLLRGRAKYDIDLNPEAEQARVNHDYVGTYTTAEWTGVEYTMSDDDSTRSPNEWSGNVHKNYNRAPAHNERNFAELNKMYIEVVCDGLNLQVMKGERIPVLIGFNNSIENDAYNNATETDIPRSINRFYSGYYIVDGIEYNYNPMLVTGGVSPYSTRFTLKRREWPTPEAI